MAKGKTTFTVNANMYARVKLTEHGIDILRHKHEELDEIVRSRGGKGIGEFKLRLDEDGYYRTQIWNLMSDFGHSMGPGRKQPFLIDIIFENGTVVEEEEEEEY